MKTTLEDMALFGAYISKSYAADMFRLLLDYHDISASEAASRLGLHIQTAQDFLEAMHKLHILGKKESIERKRPYFRYYLTQKEISLSLNLNELVAFNKSNSISTVEIRENKHSGVRFSLARNKNYFSYLVVWEGQGRNRKEKKINLTIQQGLFLYNLPFPEAEYKSVKDIMHIASIESPYIKEIESIVCELIRKGVIDQREPAVHCL